MGVNRRQFLIGGLGLAAAATTMGLTGCAPGSSESGGGGGDAGTADLAFAWWGNPTSATRTPRPRSTPTSKANPGVKIAAQPGEFGSYWDKLATQTAGNTAPDIIQMDMAYISEYGNRGALLDLARGGHLQVRRGHGRLGQDQRHLVRHQRRHQLPGRAGQPEGLREGQAWTCPDDKTWTWDSTDRHGCRGRREGGGDVRLSPSLVSDEPVPGAGPPAGQGAVHRRTAWASTPPTLRPGSTDGQGAEGRRDRVAGADQRGGRPSRWTRARSWSGRRRCSIYNSNQLEAVNAAAGHAR